MTQLPNENAGTAKKSRSFPDDLLSTDFLKKQGRNWAVLKLRLTPFVPPWVSEYNVPVGYQFFIFREIAYVESNSELVGVGRAWIPFSTMGWQVAKKAVLTLRAKTTVGQAIEQLVQNNYRVDVLQKVTKKGLLMPYAVGEDLIVHTRRVIRTDAGPNGVGHLLCLVEEDISAAIVRELSQGELSLDAE